MPHCSVPGCRSNYERGVHKTVFRFPKNEYLKEKWIRSIHRENFIVTKHSRVCEKHFSESCIIREDKAVRPDGSLLVVPRKIPKLTEDAYPTIFENLPSYMSKELPPKRKDPEIRHLQHEKRTKNEQKTTNEKNQIHSFEDLKQNFKTKCRKYLDQNFNIKICVTQIYIYKLFENISGPPIFYTICIKEDLSIKIYAEGNSTKLLENKFKDITSSTLKIQTWSALYNLLEFFNTCSPTNEDFIVNDSSSDKHQALVKLLEELINKMKFFKGQLELLELNV